MFSGDDEDGDFLSPSGGAKLASLFGLDQAVGQGNESFQYTAPKQPRKSSNPVSATQKLPPTSAAPAVLFATAVQAFRYINGQYVKQGKLGAAALGNHTTKEYKLLLYLSQQKQVTTAKIHTGFVFTVQPNNYYTFYDDQRQNWSLMFESEKASSDFCKEVCLAKVNSAASLDAVVVQDLNPGEGQEVENGDSLEVVYTGWLLQNHTIGQMFDSNQNKDKLLRLKIGAGKVIKGWEEGMLGMKKTGRRLIVVPPHLAYGSKGVPNRIPANSTLIFEAELRRVKFSKDSGSDRASASSRDSAAPSPAPSVENLTSEPAVQTTAPSTGRPGEPPLRAKSNSLSEQLANPDATKAKLISRMAKMGQPMLPFLTGVTSQPESSDSELEDTSGIRVKDQPVASSPVQISNAAPASAHVHPHPHTAPPSSLVPIMSTVAPQPGLPGSSHAFQPYSYMQTSVAPSQLQHVQTVPYLGPSDVTSFLMTEARQHNTEIRLAVGKVADKVDQLTSKIDDLQRQGSVSMGVSSMSMETSMIMHNIQRIVQENECLKKEVFEKSSRVEEQNRKIGELINQNQRYMEQSNMLLEQRNDSLKSSSEQNQARILQAEQDKVRLTEDLASSVARLSQLQLEASSHQQRAVELQSKLGSVLQDTEGYCQRITALETQLEELKETAERTQAQYRSERQKRKETELRVVNMEEELQDLRADKEGLERTLVERKKKWQAERQQRDEEVEELRKSSQQELDNVRAQLRKARTSTDNAASEQLSQLQAELEQDWRGKCEQMLTSAKEQHRRDVAELTEQRDALQDSLAQLREKHTALERQEAAVREKLERKVAELEKKLAEQENSGDTAAEVKRVMNGVFHSLRGEFDLGESYSGQAVLAVVVTTIKNVTLQLLSGTHESSLPHEEEEEEEKEEKEEEAEEEEEESDDVKHMEEKPHQNVHVNGEGQVGEEEQEEEEEEQEGAELDSPRVSENQRDQEVSAQDKTETETESKTQSQTEVSQAADLHPVSLSEVTPHETAAAECEGQRAQVEHSVPESPTEPRDADATAGPEDRHDRSSAPVDGQESAAVSREVDEENTVNGEHGGEVAAAPQEAFGPPANPPPPPDALQSGARLTEGTSEENGTEPFFQTPSPAKPPTAPSEEEEEDDMGLKGCPPPAPLFGEDEDDDDDLDWLN
ncbi:putative FK506-binding protein 15 [Scophthalmus maximus]|uniref:peptidylprolyl isomerase n=1 Tax=Scophthalmus maximus TaxID=52904 RepID=A0A2U9BQN9_SCOMX|nr:putative FK506-binding protein 15 [Scophthalmus maximus]